jgi:hypothetical protein
MNPNAAKQMNAEANSKLAWPEFLGFTAFVAAVRANFRDFGYSVSQSILVGKDRQFTVINNVHGRYRYVLVLADRRGVVILKKNNGYPELEITVEDLFKGNVVEILWPNTDPERLYPEGVGMIR